MYCSTLPADAVRKTRGLKKFLKKLFGASLCVYNVHCLVVNLKGEKHVKNNQKKKKKRAGKVQWDGYEGSLFNLLVKIPVLLWRKQT